MRASLLAALTLVASTASIGCGGEEGNTGGSTTTSTMTTGGGGSGGSGGTSPFSHAWLSDAKILVSGADANTMECTQEICRHNENTDLVVWQGAIWLVHRTAMSQVLGPNSALHVYKSMDGGKTFTQTAVLPAVNDRDLRDPHFYIVGDKLYLKALSRLPVVSKRDSDVDTVALVTSSSDGVTWSAFAPGAPSTWSLWRIQEHGGVHYSAAYEDGDKSVWLYSSMDGETWTKGAAVYTIAADTPLETELTFMPSGKLLALVRMDGTDDELLGDQGRLRTAVCWADPPYDTFDCPQTLDGQRLDGPLSFFHDGRLFHVARKHLGADQRKRTALFEITGDFAGGGMIGIKEWGELPSAGDTAYAGVAAIDDNRVLVTWYSGDLDKDAPWLFAMLDVTDIWQGTIDFSKLK